MALGLLALGVRRLAVVHVPGGGVAAAPGGRVWRQGSVRVPPAEVRSTTGPSNPAGRSLLRRDLAAGLDGFDAASCAAFLHGLAGRLASDGAPASSRDLVDALPAAYAALQ